jgi:nucleoside-diphosphate-sugar epimerase
MNKALVIGGTGPTGPFIVQGLLQRGFDVTILHSGRHEVDFMHSSVRHLHVDPFDIDALSSALAAQSYDLTIATYGRLRDTARLLARNTDRFISIGAFAAYPGAVQTFDGAFPNGTRAPFRESDPSVSTHTPGIHSKLLHILEAEQAVFEHHPAATHVRYANVYGPRHPMPVEWTIVRRVLDKRKCIIVPDNGLTIRSRVFSENAAHAVMCIVDHPAEAAGETFNVADEWAPTLRQWIEMIGRALGHEFDIVNMPFEFATPAHPMMMVSDSGHRMSLPDKAIWRLGYRTKVPVETALAQTASWLAKNPPSISSLVRLADTFDYATEDQLISGWRALEAEARAALPTTAGEYRSRYKWESGTRRSPRLSTSDNADGEIASAAPKSA